MQLSLLHMYTCKHTNLLIWWWTLFYEWYIYVEDVFAQFIFRFTRDACFRVIPTNFFLFFLCFCLLSYSFSRSTHSGWKITKLFMQKIFYCIFGCFCFVSLHRQYNHYHHSLLLYTSAHLFQYTLSQSLCTLYNLTDCAYANMQFRFIFRDFYFKQPVVRTRRTKRRKEDWITRTHTRLLSVYGFWSFVFTLPHHHLCMFMGLCFFF